MIVIGRRGDSYSARPTCNRTLEIGKINKIKLQRLRRSITLHQSLFTFLGRNLKFFLINAILSACFLEIRKS